MRQVRYRGNENLALHILMQCGAPGCNSDFCLSSTGMSVSTVYTAGSRKHFLKSVMVIIELSNTVKYF